MVGMDMTRTSRGVLHIIFITFFYPFNELSSPSSHLLSTYGIVARLFCLYWHVKKYLRSADSTGIAVRGASVFK
jgi:hypothetical protein